MSGTPEEERTKQLAWHTAEASRLAGLLTEGNDRISDWRYVPPRSDDWQEWGGVTRWCAVERLYRWEIYREGQLTLGQGPFYCPAHGERRPAPGWRASNCRDCQWEETIYDDALQFARELGRPGRAA